MRKLLLTLFVLATCSISQAHAEEQIPRFEDFPAKEVFKGKPAKVRIVSPQDRKFAARLQQLSGRRPNYAGHYTLASWGCGASCVTTVAIDTKTGNVVWLPFSVCCWDVDVNEPIEFRRDSTLIIVHGSRNETGGGTYYYRLLGSGFVLVKGVEKSTS